MPEPQNLIDQELLRNLVPLNTLSEEQFARVIDQVTVQRAARGDYLFHEGDTDQQNVYLLTGRVTLFVGHTAVESVSGGTNVSRYPLAHRFPRKYSGRADTPLAFVRIDNRLLSAVLARSQANNYEVSEVDTGTSGDWMAQVLGSSIFQLLPPGNIQAALMRIERHQVATGEAIIRQGEEGDYYYFISKGTCRLTRADPKDGTEHELAQLGPGDGFGEDALLSGSPRNCSVTMTSDGCLLRLSKQDFEDLIKSPIARFVSHFEAETLVKRGAVWLDVRPQAEHDASHLLGSINLPFELLRYQISSLAPRCTYVVYGTDDGVSSAAAFQLAQRGFDAVVLRQGKQWLPSQHAETPAEGPKQFAAPAKENVVNLVSRRSVEKPEAPEQPVGSSGSMANPQLAAAEQRILGLEQQLVELLNKHKAEHDDWARELEAARAAALPVKRQDQSAAAELATLRRDLRRADTRARRLERELAEAEDRYASETEEIHQLWEKRLGELERRAEAAQAVAQQEAAQRSEAEKQLAALRRKCAQAGISGDE